MGEKQDEKGKNNTLYTLIHMKVVHGAQLVVSYLIINTSFSTCVFVNNAMIVYILQ